MAANVFPVRGWLLLTAVIAVHGAAGALKPGTAQEVGELSGTLGVGDEPAREVFGRIGDVLVDDQGVVMVVDELAQSVSVFNRHLQWVGSIGKPGGGPEDFGRGLAGTVTESSEIVIADAGNGRLARYAVTDGGIDFLGTVRVQYPAVDICALGDRIFVHANVTDNLVHEIGDDGQILRSFGPRERFLDGAGHFHDQAYLACDEGTNSIILAHRFIPLVRAFSAEGTELWRIELEDYHQQQFRSIDGRCCAYMIPNSSSGSYHMIDSAVSTSDGSVFVSLREERPGSERRFELRRLNVRTGRETGRVNAPGALTMVANGYGYFLLPEPFPHILIHVFTP